MAIKCNRAGIVQRCSAMVWESTKTEMVHMEYPPCNQTWLAGKSHMFRWCSHSNPHLWMFDYQRVCMYHPSIRPSMHPCIHAFMHPCIHRLSCWPTQPTLCSRRSIGASKFTLVPFVSVPNLLLPINFHDSWVCLKIAYSIPWFIMIVPLNIYTLYTYTYYIYIYVYYLYIYTSMNNINKQVLHWLSVTWFAFPKKKYETSLVHLIPCPLSSPPAAIAKFRSSMASLRLPAARCALAWCQPVVATTHLEPAGNEKMFKDFKSWYRHHKKKMVIDKTGSVWCTPGWYVLSIRNEFFGGFKSPLRDPGTTLRPVRSKHAGSCLTWVLSTLQDCRNLEGMHQNSRLKK